jgi:hypothetical protein
MAGLNAVCAEGRVGGWRRMLKPQEIEAAWRHMTEGERKSREVAK